VTIGKGRISTGSYAFAQETWRQVGISYLRYANICAQVVRRSLKEPLRSKAAGRDLADLRVRRNNTLLFRRALSPVFPTLLSFSSSSQLPPTRCCIRRFKPSRTASALLSVSATPSRPSLARPPPRTCPCIHSTHFFAIRLFPISPLLPLILR
jgi:hypothetical protein